MKVQSKKIDKNWQEIVLVVCIVLYILYFSIYTIARYRALYANYYDLGIMQQTVYNTFRALQTLDLSRFLELTNPHGIDQIKRMAIHNDPFLAFLAPFYFFYSGPETLLVLQSIALGWGALFVFLIGEHIFVRHHYAKHISLLFALVYLMYPPLQKMNQFDVHAVAFATPLLLGMYYFFLKRQYKLMICLALAALLTKEQVGLTLGFFGIYILITTIKERKKEKVIPYWVIPFIVCGFIWFLFSMMWVIPYFRKGVHFALEYFQVYGDSTESILLGMMKNPLHVLQTIVRKESFDYLFLLLTPVGFLSLFSLPHFFISFPELLMNLLSKNETMRTIYFQYSAVLIPFIFISAMYGWNNIEKVIKKKNMVFFGCLLLLSFCTLYSSYEHSPLFYSKTKETNSFFLPTKERDDVFLWQQKLSDESIRVMTSGNIAPAFASRRYLYNISSSYVLADYIVLSVDNVYNGYGSETAVPAYTKLQKDSTYKLIYRKDSLEVYRKL